MSSLSFKTKNGTYDIKLAISYKDNRKGNGKRLNLSTEEFGKLIKNTVSSAVIISNHVTAADGFYTNCIARESGQIANLRYFIKDSIAWIPIVGVHFIWAGFIALKRGSNWARDLKIMRNVFSRYQSHPDRPLFLVMFPEGTRWTPKKLLDAKEYAKKNNRPVPKNVTLPRHRGFVNTLEALENVTGLKDVLDVTLALKDNRTGYSHTGPTMFEMISGQLDNYSLHFHVDHFSVDQVRNFHLGLETNERVENWLKWRYEVKDGLLDEIYNEMNAKLIPDHHKL